MVDGIVLWVGWMDVGGAWRGSAAWARIKVPSIDRSGAGDEGKL